jgi:hypothetical protein
MLSLKSGMILGGNYPAGNRLPTRNHKKTGKNNGNL